LSAKTRTKLSLRSFKALVLYEKNIQWGSELNKEFSPEEYRMAEKHLKKCSASLFIREMQIKTTLRITEVLLFSFLKFFCSLFLKHFHKPNYAHIPEILV
jgi:hypothetical protein